MITLNYKDEQHLIPNSLDELTVGQFEEVSRLLSQLEVDIKDKWIQVFQYLKVPDYIINDLEEQHFVALVQGFNLIPKVPKIVKTLYIDGVKCFAYTDKFKLTVRDSIVIDEYIQANNVFYLAEVLAIIYKDPKLDKDQVNDKKLIKSKAEYIRLNVTADVVYPILAYISQKLISEYNVLKDSYLND